MVDKISYIVNCVIPGAIIILALYYEINVAISGVEIILI